ncbi:MAG: helix-turn-helix transcriptional regulator [Ardenticatenales bacterium]|nr:helix-turn-helix transcriptional regulator [Ardenticatenales bacterium]
MHRKEPNPDEPIYVISVAARMVNLHPQTLRHYEKMGLVEPARTQGGVRMYSQQDIEKLQKINSLIADLGVNLAGVEVILNMSKQIEELQAQLEEIQASFQIEIERVQRAYLEDQARHRRRLPDRNDKKHVSGP